MHNAYVHQPCTSTSCNVPKDIIHGMYQSYAFINMPTMCIHQYANHVHLPICQPCIISLMICLHHEPSATIRYLKQMPIVVLIKQYQWCSIIRHMSSMSVPNMYITMHQYHKMMNPIFVCQILHKTCANQTSSNQTQEVCVVKFLSCLFS